MSPSSERDERACIVAMGASTSVGRDPWSSAAAVRAGISGLRQHPFMIDSAGEPMRVATAPWLDISLTGVDRFEALLFPAIDQALRSLDSVAGKRLRVALALGLPGSRPGLPRDLERRLLQRIREQPDARFDGIATFAAGHAAGLLAMDAAVAGLAGSDFDAWIIAGVDSYIDPTTLEWLEACDQLHGAGPLNNAWGFIPGEAGAAVAVMRAAAARDHGLIPLASVIGTSRAQEDKRIKTETVCIGEGLTDAFRIALASLPARASVTDMYCDLNGEPYRADEYGFAALRTSAAFDSASEFVAPADCWGDVAAAGGVLNLMLATAAGVKLYANGNTAFVWASSESGERAAVLLVTGAGH